jgi:hypothetical protein
LETDLAIGEELGKEDIARQVFEKTEALADNEINCWEALSRDRRDY